MDNRSLLDFLTASVTPFHVVRNAKEYFLKKGFVELFEQDAWQPSRGGRYFVIRGGGSLIAFVMPDGEARSFQIAAAHTDSPSFLVKGLDHVEGATRMRVEKYGSPVLSSWLDRPLSFGGRVMLSDGDGVRETLISLSDMALIPSVPPHLMKGKELNVAVDLLPLFCEREVSLEELLAKKLGCDEKSIVSHELYLCLNEAPRIWGEDAYISAARLDDLACVYPLMTAISEAKPTDAISVLSLFSHEEIGSRTAEGAASTFLSDVLSRLAQSESERRDAYQRMLALSFMISADNAHAVHPNHPELSDARTGSVYMNQGVVIKHSSARRYTTDALSEALTVSLCREENIPFQKYYNRADIAGGSTLGCVSIEGVSVRSVDVGVAQLAMHSSYETSSLSDVLTLQKLARAYFSKSLSRHNNLYSWR